MQKTSITSGATKDQRILQCEFMREKLDLFLQIM